MIGVAGFRAPALRLGVALFCIGSTIFLQLIDSSMQHWAILPVVLCGILVASLPYRFVAFHPTWLLAPLYLHFFFVAPIVQLFTKREMSYVQQPPDWPTWIGIMASLNVCALLVMAIGWRFGLRVSPTRSEWKLDESRFVRILVPTLAVSACLQAWVYFRMGGISGYIEAYETRSEAFSGMASIFIISEAFPILLFIGYAVFARRHSWLGRPGPLLLVGFGFIALKFWFGGLRGSRSNTIWEVLWAVGIIHLYVRRLPKLAFVCGLAAILLFTYVYGFYKQSGREAVREAIVSGTSAAAEATGRDALYVLLGDLSRTQVQAYVAYRLLERAEEYKFALGRSYIGAMAMIVPRAIWPGRPETKVYYGTALLHGQRALFGDFRSSRQYGLGGEAMMNFGVIGLIVAYFVYGFAVGLFSKKVESLSRGDCRWLFVPLLSVFFILGLTSDSDNIVFFLVKNCTLPVAVVWCSLARPEAIK